MDKQETKVVYAYDDKGAYQSQKMLDWTDRSPISGAWQIPAGCTEVVPLENKDGFDIIWNGTSWEYQEKTAEPEEPEPPTEPTEDEKLQMAAASAKANLQTMAINAMMMTLAGNDISDARQKYETNLMSISDDVALKMPDVFTTWSGDSVEYKKDTKLTYNDVLYKVLQDHTSQASWTPDAAPSLFAKVLTSTDGEPTQWIQPDSTNPYMTGDKVIYNGHCYQSTIDNNVWAPDAYPDGWNMLY